MSRSCPQHGPVETLVWHDVEHYRWIRSLAFDPVRPNESELRPVTGPCPTSCGICMRHRRRPTLVEIEVTQRCNLRCPVCFMSAGPEARDMPLAELRAFYEAIARTATTDVGVQLTGGEPTVHPELANIIALGRSMGFWGVEVNTNGVAIASDLDYLRTLVDAGLTGVYLQFDGLTPGPYQQLRGADLLAVKLKAVENCRAAGVQAVLAMTVVSGTNDAEIGGVIDYALANVDVIAGVALQPAFTSGRFDATRVEPLTMGDVIRLLDEQTSGLVRTRDIVPLGCSHPLCDTGTYLVPDARAEHPSGYRAITRDLTRDEYRARYRPDSPQGSVFSDILAHQGISTERGLSVIVMNFMDAWTCDLERMEECSMFVTMANGALIPFCSYQLTDKSGCRLYAPWGDALAEKGTT